MHSGGSGNEGVPKGSKPIDLNIAHGDWGPRGLVAWHMHFLLIDLCFGGDFCCLVVISGDIL